MGLLAVLRAWIATGDQGCGLVSIERDHGSDWLRACCCMRASIQIQMKGARLPEKLHGLSVLTRPGNSCAQIDTA
jgi:hypothetical protein